MQDLTDDERKQVLGEVFMEEFKAIREGIAELPTRSEFNELRADVNELKSDVKIVKAAVTDVSHHVNDHKHRITSLEQAA